MMKQKTLWVLLASAFVAPAIVVAAQSESSMSVNGKSIPAHRMEAALKSRMAQGQPDSPELRKGIRDMLINQEVISQEAVKKGLDKQPAVAGRLELDRAGVLANAFFEDYFKRNPITDDMLRKEYERIKPELPSKEYRVRHILVEKEDDAKNIIAQIRKGGSFEKLAAEHSRDPGSSKRGGDLDWAPAENYVKPFHDAVVKAKKGALIETPVKTDFGFHVIRVEDERATKVPPFEEVKPQLTQMVQNQVVQKTIADLRAKAKVD